MIPDLVLVGNLLVDDVVYADGTGRPGQPGGALLHAALAASAWGARVGCVSLVGNDYPPEALDLLASRGVSLEGVLPLGAPGGRFRLRYGAAGRTLEPLPGRPSHEAVSPEPSLLPTAWEHARALHLAPMPLSRQRAWVEALEDGVRFVSLEPHEPVRESTLPRWGPLLSRCDAFFPSGDELSLTGADERPWEALQKLASGRLRYVFHKRGRGGGTLYDALARRAYAWSSCEAREVDPTGAGDAFAAAFLTGVVEGVPVEECLARGAATASVAVEGRGSDALARTNRLELQARARACRVAYRNVMSP